MLSLVLCSVLFSDAEARALLLLAAAQQQVAEKVHAPAPEKSVISDRWVPDTWGVDGPRPGEPLLPEARPPQKARPAAPAYRWHPTTDRPDEWQLWWGSEFVGVLWHGTYYSWHDGYWWAKAEGPPIPPPLRPAATPATPQRYSPVRAGRRGG